MPRPTAEERAKELCREKWPLKDSTFPRSARVIDRICRDLSKTIHEAEEVAQQKERETCAVIAATYSPPGGYGNDPCKDDKVTTGDDIAERIRAQSSDQVLPREIVKQHPNFDLEIALRALHVIEGLTFEDITMLPKEKIEEIYMYAHIGSGHCGDSHPEWCKRLAEAEEALVKAGIIDAFPQKEANDG